jgi:hypothetical protein
MKICGCSNCRRAGEVNPYELFEDYLARRVVFQEKEFEDIFLSSYTLEEMTEVYDEYEESFNIAEQIKAYTMKEKNED